MAPTFLPDPPEGQVAGPMIGEPVMPSPTTGSSSAKMKATFLGQPLTNGLGPLTVELPALGQQLKRRSGDRSRVDAAVLVRVVFLVGTDHDLWLAVAGQVADRR